MRLCLSCTFALTLAATAATAHATTPFDAAARAKAVAPVIEEETAIVVHLDLSRISPRPMLDFLEGARLVSPMDLRSPQVEGFLRENVKDIYLVAPPGIFADRQSQMLMAVPLASAEREKSVRAAIRLLANEGRMVGNLLAVGRSERRTFQPVERSDLAAAFEAAGDTAAQVVLIPPAATRRVVDELLPQLPESLGGGPSSVLTRGVRWAAAGIDASPRKAFRLVVQSDNAGAAEALRGKLSDLFRLAGQRTEVRNRVPQFETVAAFLTPKVEGDRLIVSSRENMDAFAKALTALARPLLEAEARAVSMNDLKQIGLAMHNYYTAYKHFPLPASRGPDGKPLLSWRVHILPYLDQPALYKQFHLDEPWDSAHNRTLIDKMPAVYRVRLSTAELGRTNYVVPVGNGAAFEAAKPIEIMKDITDGTSNTIMVVTVDDQHAVVWTSPEDWPFDPKEPTRGLARFFNGSFSTLFCDGSARWFAWPESPKQVAKLRAAFTRAGGEVSNW